ncbi:hypothetical protein DINM_005072 [Dirofilaria immitis]|nr:hypothetical protein [Dirofilaria immitis]
MQCPQSLVSLFENEVILHVIEVFLTFVCPIPNPSVHPSKYLAISHITSVRCVCFAVSAVNGKSYLLMIDKELREDACLHGLMNRLNDNSAVIEENEKARRLER